MRVVATMVGHGCGWLRQPGQKPVRKFYLLLPQLHHRLPKSAKVDQLLTDHWYPRFCCLALWSGFVLHSICAIRQKVDSLSVYSGNSVELRSQAQLRASFPSIQMETRESQMKINEIFRLQDRAASENVRRFETQFEWCYHSVELMLDSHTFLANDPEILAHRKRLSESDTSEFRAMNAIVNMAYDAMGSLISALRLLEHGVLADAWSLIRGAFESTCYAEFFALNKGRVAEHTQIGEAIKHNRSANVGTELRKVGLAIGAVMKSLQKHDGQNRTGFYSRLCNFGTHASPVRPGLRIRVDEAEVRSYLSIGHRELMQCLADFAATAKYTLSIPFVAWPELMERKMSLFSQYRSLLEEYKTIYEPA
jgi:hypothetical protein